MAEPFKRRQKYGRSLDFISVASMNDQGTMQALTAMVAGGRGVI